MKKIIGIVACLVIGIWGCADGTISSNSINSKNDNDKKQKAEYICESPYIYEDGGETAELAYKIWGTPQEVIEESSYIIDGEVVDISQKIVESSYAKYWNVYTIKNIHVYKGKINEETIEFKISNLNLEYLKYKLPEVIDISIGDKCLFLLNKRNDEFTISTAAQSIYHYDIQEPIVIGGVNISREEILKEVK